MYFIFRRRCFRCFWSNIIGSKKSIKKSFPCQLFTSSLFNGLKDFKLIFFPKGRERVRDVNGISSLLFLLPLLLWLWRRQRRETQSQYSNTVQVFNPTANLNVETLSVRESEREHKKWKYDWERRWQSYTCVIWKKGRERKGEKETEGEISSIETTKGWNVFK